MDLSREHARGADLTFAWLRELDPDEPARQQLQAAGVPQATANNLYPTSFTALVPGLVGHLQAKNLRHLLEADARGELEELTAQVVGMVNGQSLSRCAGNRAKEWRESGSNSDSMDPLRSLLTEKLQHADRGGELIAYSCTSTLWHAWWFRERCTGVQEVVVTGESLLHWLGEQLLCLPNLPAWWR